jgi:deoxyribodipyrimidine photolyase-related protein
MEHSFPSVWVYIHPDQLRPEHLLNALPESARPTAGFLFIESSHRWKQLPFHKKRIIFEISAMRHLAADLAQQGRIVHYAITDAPFNEYLTELLQHGNTPTHGIFNTIKPPSSGKTPLIHTMEPASLDECTALQSIHRRYPNLTTLHKNNFFLADTEIYRPKIAPGYRMEYFYRDMRKKLGLLMEPSGEPAGGEWNYDKDNRKPLPRNIDLPRFPEIQPDALTREVIALVDMTYPNHFGHSEGFSMAVTQSDAERLADHFFGTCIAHFGPFEDAMAKGEAYVFHSALSAYLNVGLLDPLLLCRRAEQAWRLGTAPLNSVEGFIRQIIGWREFVRIYYEAMMPEVRESNALNFHRDLPDVFWSGKSGMSCMDDIVGGVLHHGWSHHITRLMVLSNFANLTETNPFVLYEWFWYAYTDAHDWVVLPNVLGMSTFADGGVLASKPYVSGGNYINKMSDYCASCKYSIKEKTGERACPFNYLYWNFVDRKRDWYNENGRVSFMVAMFDKRPEDEKNDIRQSATTFIENLPRWSKKSN